MSGITDGIIVGIAGCAKAGIAIGDYLKNSFVEQRAYVNGNEELRAEMETLHARLEHSLIRPESLPVIQAHVHTLATAQSVPEFRHAAAQVTNAIQAEHEAIAVEIAPLVAAATKHTEFETVRQLQSPGRITIIGQDLQGKALQTEILSTPGKPLTIRTETLNYSDHTCDETLTQFQEHLEAQGVTINQTRRTNTLRQRLRSRLAVHQ